MSKKQRTINRKLKSEGYCEEHDNFNELRCMDCATWICGVCVALKHKLCRTLLVLEALKELKIQVKNQVKEEMVRVKEVSERIIEHSDSLLKKQKCLTDELTACEVQIHELENLKLNGNKFYDQLKKIQTLVDNSMNWNDLANAKMQLPNVLEALNKTHDDLHFYVTLVFWCKNGDVYAVAHQDTIRYGKITVVNGQIWVSSFQTEKPEAKLIPFKELLDKLCSSELPRRTFLQLTTKNGSEEEVEVAVVIETDRLNPRGINFIFICSGLKDSTFKGLDLEDNYGLPDVTPGYGLCTEFEPFVGGILDDATRTFMKMGDVSGIGQHQIFFAISLEDNDEFPQHKFGIVISGFQQLLDIYEQNPKLFIKDCGLVI